MTVSFHKNQSRVVHPWMSADLGDPVLGSAFQARVFISNPTIRGLVRSFASAGKRSDIAQRCLALMSRHAQCSRHAGTGLTAADLDQLQGLLGADEHGRLLFPFLVTADPPAHEPQPSRLHAVQRFRPMLACLGSSAPVSQYMRPAVSHLVDRMLQVRACKLIAASSAADCLLRDVKHDASVQPRCVHCAG